MLIHLPDDLLDRSVITVFFFFLVVFDIENNFPADYRQLLFNNTNR